MSPKEIDPKERIKQSFSDVLLEAEEFIVDKRITAPEVMELMAEAFTDWWDYYQQCADVYQHMFDALYQRFRNK